MTGSVLVAGNASGELFAGIRAIVSDPKNKVEVEAFIDFVEELRDDLNDQITNEEVIEMLAQHLIAFVSGAG